MSELHTLLKRELALVNQFKGLLEAEQTALMSGAADAITALHADKMALVESLNACEQARLELTQLDASALDKAGMTQWLAQHPDEAAAAEVWRAILSEAGQAKELNELNGQLIALHLGRTNEALAILTERQRAEALYGSDGHTASGSSGRILDSA